MKATLEFNLPEEQERHYDAINGSQFKYCLQELEEQLRVWIKYGHTFENVEDALAGARKHLHDLIYDNNLSLE